MNVGLQRSRASLLAKFSDRLGNLVAAVEHAKRDIDKVHSCFAEAHDNVLEEMNATINRTQKGLLEVLGEPAQATALADVKATQAQVNERLALLEGRADLVQKQLHVISEQQGHILTSLATITPLAPLLRDSPQQQNQIFSTLVSLLPALHLLQKLPAQVKASQQEILESFIDSIDLDRSASSRSPKLVEPLGAISDSPPVLYLKRKLSNSKGVDDQQCSETHVSNNRTEQPVTPRPSSRTLDSETPPQRTSALAQQPVVLSECSNAEPLCNPVFSSVPDHGDLLFRPVPTVFPRDPKPRRIEQSPVPEIQRTDPRLHSAAETSNPTSSSDTPTKKKPRLPARATATPRNEIFRTPAFLDESRAPSLIHRAPLSTSSAPTPHAPGAFFQPRSTVPGRFLAATSDALDHTPPRAPQPPGNKMNARFFKPTESFPPCAPPSAGHSIQISSEIAISNPVDEHVSSPHLLARKQPVRRNSQQRILLEEDADEDVEIDLDWGAMSCS
ncbi:hypothetical protein K439DRAFT_744336 [Ramaria rubella]|nr:hypothetical protein K439DRAFT_744336 [Ramaria rubella]